MSTLQQLRNDVGRALAVLSMLFLCFAAAPPDLPGASVAQQAGSVGSLYSLCGGGHGAPQLACHAPNACCRPDQALAPPRTIAPEPAYRNVAIVDYAAYRAATTLAANSVAFRSRAPPP